MQDIMWLLMIGVFFYIAYYFNAWVIPVVIVLFWPDFAGVNEPMNYSNGMLVAVYCAAAGIFFSRGIIAVIVGMFLGKQWADRVRNS